MAKVKILKLVLKDRKKLNALTKTGVLKARKMNRCRILLLASQPKTKDEIAKILNVSKHTVIKTTKRYAEGGLNTALNEKPRPGAPTIFDGRKKAKITALACTKAPKGAARWSLRLLADKAVELKIVDDISCVTIGKILKKTNLNRT